MSGDFLKVWLQGGDADGWVYFTLIEPPSTIYIKSDPFRNGEWIRVLGDWPDAIEYRREAQVEQFAFERIYYPAES